MTRPARIGVLPREHRLQARRAVENRAKELGRGGRGIDRSAKTERCEHRQAAAVVHVRVRDDDGVEVIYVDRRYGGVAPLNLSRALHHAEIDQHAGVRRFDERARAGDLAGGAEECQTRAGHWVIVALR